MVLDNRLPFSRGFLATVLLLDSGSQFLSDILAKNDFTYHASVIKRSVVKNSLALVIQPIARYLVNNLYHRYSRYSRHVQVIAHEGLSVKVHQ